MDPETLNVMMQMVGALAALAISVGGISAWLLRGIRQDLRAHAEAADGAARKSEQGRRRLHVLVGWIGERVAALEGALPGHKPPPKPPRLDEDE